MHGPIVQFLFVSVSLDRGDLKSSLAKAVRHLPYSIESLPISPNAPNVIRLLPAYGRLLSKKFSCLVFFDGNNLNQCTTFQRD